ncbi:hypothetical protein [Blastococcus saxobsidens]|uniref:WXG100 family type VII secretion target n=1 Tax=Blastococcus saxobsidens (strain DD2) TaxID=1146883 RepID=H6RUY2_BLASD|nr:hypothetical protein [Blastococcus saxobsidens]CCG04504.1 membrane protein of unknown function [Blastococcus saxobsidens DD2]
MSRPRDWTPLRPSDPVGGDPAAIARLAQRYAATAAAISTAATALREIHDSTTVWESEAGRAFRDRTTEVGDTIVQARERYERTAAALAGYATTLDGIQAEADLVLARAKRAEAARDAAWRARERNSALSEADPVAGSRAHDDAAAATADIHAAGADLRELEDEWRSAGNAAADAIEEVNSGDRLEDDVWDDLLDAVRVITGWAGDLSALLGVLSVALSVIPALQPFAALLAAAALVLGLVSLAGSSVLLFHGRAALGDVLLGVVSVVTFGAGRAFVLAGQAVRQGARGLARPAFIRSQRARGASPRQADRIALTGRVTGGGRPAKANTTRAVSGSGCWPTRSEWASAYRPSSIHTPPATGRAPEFPAGTDCLPEVAAALRRARYADTGAQVSGVAGLGVSSAQLTIPEGPPRPPVSRDR